MLLLLFLSALTVWLTHELYWKRRNWPPGPCPLPIFGNLLSLNSPPPGYEAFSRWTKQFGDAYTFWVGNTPCVMISSYETMRNTFIRDGDNYVDKKCQPMMELFRGGQYGVIDSNGATWREHRRFALSSLRDYGLGKNLMQEKILIEVDDLFKRFDASEGVEIQIPDVFEKAIANVINQVVFGYRFDESRDKEFRELKKIIDAPQEMFSGFLIFLASNVPAFAKLLPKRYFEKPFEDFRDSSFGFFGRHIEEHRTNIDFSEQEESTDFVEAYLREQKKREADGDTDSFSTHQLANICLDLWFAGLGSTTNTVTWAISYMLNHPSVQESIHEEMDRVIGSDRLITTADKNQLPYLNAFINESQRCANIVPLNLQHVTSRDTVINGFHVPKGAAIIAQISTVLYDEKTFPEPETFRPERFLDADGKLKKVDELVPFSVGKRQCLGEGLARMELFLFLANFLNRYQLSASREGPPSLKKEMGAIIAPRVFSGIVKRRHCRQ